MVSILRIRGMTAILKKGNRPLLTGEKESKVFAVEISIHEFAIVYH